jgi:beta-glucanase (GH16 family)
MKRLLGLFCLMILGCNTASQVDTSSDPDPGSDTEETESQSNGTVSTDSTTEQIEGWTLIWSDEFEGSGLPDSSKWGYEEGFVRNGEAQFYVAERLENARLEGGHLVITARKDGYEGHEISSASLTTAGKASWTYARIEVRAKVPPGRGTWPAIWMLGTNIGQVGWPTCGEIDLMEYVGYDPDHLHFNIHTEAYNHMLGTNKGVTVEVMDAASDFHVYAIEWTKERIDFLLDSDLVFSFANEHTGNSTWPYDAPLYLLLNLAIGGSWGGLQGIDDALFPAEYFVDYVRVYEKTP